VIECPPAVKVDVANVATPEEFNVPVPSAVVPSLNVTVPVGVEVPVGVTVAVNVTAVPEFAGFELEVTVVVVADPLKFVANAFASTEPRPVTRS
jgi:hypothetical protein